MLEIQALTYNDLPPVTPVGGRLPKEGGTVGRGSDNALVLPDPIKTVSRTHLNFVLRSGNTYQVINVSNRNPAIINERVLNPGQKRVIKNGDRIMIGSYVLEARCANADEAPSATGGEMDSLLQQSDLDRLSEPVPEASSATLAPEPNVASPRRSERKLMQALDSLGAGLETFVGKNAGPANNTGAATGEPSQDPRATGSGEESLDPMVLFGGDGSSDPNSDMPAKKGEKSVKPVKPASTNASHGSVLKSPLASQPKKPPTDAEVVPPSGARADTEDDLERFLMGLGDDSAVPPNEQPPAPAPLVKSDEKTLLATKRKTHVEDVGESPPVKPEARKTSRKAKPVAAEIFETAPTQATEAPTRIQAKTPPPARKGKRAKADPAVPATAEELYAALIEGLGIELLPNRDTLDPDFMRLIGQLLHSYAQGTISLIAGRAVIKQEVRANVTLIAPERNNPLKFSPDANVALLHMLGQRLPGFMEPLESVQQAFIDLYAHQIGVISGMQSALSHVLDRFDPEVIREERPRGFMGQLLEAYHKADLWDAYGRYYHKTRANAVDHFQDFFGSAFLAAYEKVIAEQTDNGDET